MIPTCNCETKFLIIAIMSILCNRYVIKCECLVTMTHIYLIHVNVPYKWKIFSNWFGHKVFSLWNDLHVYPCCTIIMYSTIMIEAMLPVPDFRRANISLSTLTFAGPSEWGKQRSKNHGRFMQSAHLIIT